MNKGTLLLLASVLCVSPLGCSGPAAAPTIPDPPSSAQRDLFSQVVLRVNGTDVESQTLEVAPAAEVKIDVEFTPSAAVGVVAFVKCHFLMDGPDERPRIVKDWPAVDIPPPGPDGRVKVQQSIRAPDRAGDYELRVSAFSRTLDNRPAVAVAKVRVAN